MKFKFANKELIAKYPTAHAIVVEVLKEFNTIIKNEKVKVDKSLCNDVVFVRYTEKGGTHYCHSLKHTYHYMKEQPSNYNYLQFNLAHLTRNIGPWYMEYRSFGHLPVIGNIIADTMEDKLRRVVWHECAHVLEQYLQDGILKGTKGHGREFKKAYEDLVTLTENTYSSPIRQWTGARIGSKIIEGKKCIYNGKWRHNAGKVKLPKSHYYELLNYQVQDDGVWARVKPAFCDHYLPINLPAFEITFKG